MMHQKITEIETGTHAPSQHIMRYLATSTQPCFDLIKSSLLMMIMLLFFVSSTAMSQQKSPSKTVAKAKTTILITGATSGLGRRLAEELAGPNTLIIVHGRDKERAADVLAAIKRAKGTAVFYPADFSSLKQVDALSKTILANHSRLDVLINNAGIYYTPGEGRTLSQDGYELRFAVNYLAPVLLTQQLLPLLKSSAPARIVNIASIGQQEIDFNNVMLSHGYSGQRAYSQSKLALIMFSFDLAQALEGTGVTVNAIHPATYMDTAMVQQAQITPRSSVQEGVQAVLPLVLDPKLSTQSGRYFDGKQPARAHPHAYDQQVRERLQRLTQQLILVK